MVERAIEQRIRMYDQKHSRMKGDYHGRIIEET